MFFSPHQPATVTLYAVRRHRRTVTFQVRVLGYTGQRFTLEASTNLVSWLPIAPVTLRASEYLFIDLASRGLPGRFYRALPAP